MVPAKRSGHHDVMMTADPQSIDELDERRSAARRRHGLVLLGALLVGLAAGWLTPRTAPWLSGFDLGGSAVILLLLAIFLLTLAALAALPPDREERLRDLLRGRGLLCPETGLLGRDAITSAAREAIALAGARGGYGELACVRFELRPADGDGDSLPTPQALACCADGLRRHCGGASVVGHQGRGVFLALLPGASERHAAEWARHTSWRLHSRLLVSQGAPTELWAGVGTFSPGQRDGSVKAMLAEAQRTSLPWRSRPTIPVAHSDQSERGNTARGAGRVRGAHVARLRVH